MSNVVVRLRYIRAFLRRGVYVVPLQEQSKKPMAGYSSRRAINSIKEARRFFLAHPQANYGLVTGRNRGVLLIDVDSTEGKLALSQLREAGGRLPKTVKVLTHRGFHLYYHVPDGVVVGNRKLAPGLDLKGDGGYGVGPGQRPSDGGSLQVPARSAHF